MSDPTPDRILDATERLLGRFGYQKMTIDDIAHEAGVARRTIYLHFKSKEDVALRSIDRVVDRVQHKLREIAAGTDPPDSKIVAMLIARVMTRFDSVRDYYQSLDDMFAALRPAYMARRQRYFDDEAAIFASVLVEGIQDGTFQPSDPNTTVNALLWATNALLPSSLTAKELGQRRQVFARATAIAKLLVAGLKSRPVHDPSHSRTTRSKAPALPVGPREP